MKRLLVSMLVAGAVALAGCNNTSGTGGSTGTTVRSGTGGTTESRTSSYGPSGTASHGTTEATTRTGVPGDHGTTQTATTHGAAPANTGSGGNATFTLSGPMNLLPIAIKQGERKEVTVKVNRGADFKEPVTLKVENQPTGVTVKPDKASVAADENEDKVWIEAAKDAPLGEQTINIDGVPANGAPTGKPLQIKIKIEKAG